LIKPRPFTAAEQAAARAKGLLRIRQQQAQTKDYKKNWLDAAWWQSLAAARGIRLPPWYGPADRRQIEILGKTPRENPFS